MADVTDIGLGRVNKFGINDKGRSNNNIDGEEEETVVASPCAETVFSQDGGVDIGVQVGGKVIACF
jgi:hypothetical protein